MIFSFLFDHKDNSFLDRFVVDVFSYNVPQRPDVTFLRRCKFQVTDLGIGKIDVFVEVRNMAGELIQHIL